MTELRQRLLVVLDLDETLVHGGGHIPRELADFHSGPCPCMVRPNARTFVKDCLDRYDVAVWTSAGEDHAHSVVGALFPDLQALSFVWTAAQCTERRDPETYESVSIKDLRKVRRAGYSLERTVVVDDSPEKHTRNFGNLLRVTPWTGQPGDTFSTRCVVDRGYAVGRPAWSPPDSCPRSG